MQNTKALPDDTSPQDQPRRKIPEIAGNPADLIQWVLQYQLASYIGLKPESLSRIRKRMGAEVSKGGGVFR